MIMIILNKLLVAFVGSIIYSLFSFFITYGLYKIKSKEFPSNYEESLTYSLITNFIIIFLILLFFNIEV